MCSGNIEGIDGLSLERLREEIDRGGRFVFFEYCISLIVITLRRPSSICFLPAHRWGWWRGLPYTLATLFLGWWGLPWGFLYSPIVLMTNMAGGCDVTAQTCAYLGVPYSKGQKCDDA